VEKKKGSAILIAVLFVTAIGSLAFSFGKILLADITSANIYENGVGSYYAAESGVEEGMLRYRFSPNSSVPSDEWNLGSPNKVYRSDMTSKTTSTGENIGIDKIDTEIDESTDQLYDLRMGYIGSANDQPFWGTDLDGGGLGLSDLANDNYGTGLPSLKVAKDDVLKVAVPGDFDMRSPNTLKLFMVFENPLDQDGTVNESEAVVEVKAVLKRPTLPRLFEYKKLIAYSKDIVRSITFTDSSDGNYVQINDMQTLPNGKKGLTVNDLYGSLISITPESGTEVEFYFRPLFNNIRIGLTSESCQSGLLGTCDGSSESVIPGPVSRIISSGYYAGTVKTLEVNIDRQTGTLYDLFDSVIYSANDNAVYTLTFQNSGDCTAQVIINNTDTYQIPSGGGGSPGSVAVKYPKDSVLSIGLSAAAGQGTCSPSSGLSSMQDITGGVSNAIDLVANPTNYTLDQNSTINASTYMNAN